jgi:hypothetical protein
MLGFVRKSSVERLLREVLAERERVVQTLVEQLQFCRAQQGAPTITVQRAASGELPIEATPLSDDMEIKINEIPSDDEEQLDALLQAGMISRSEHAKAVEALKARNPDDIIE